MIEISSIDKVFVTQQNVIFEVTTNNNEKMVFIGDVERTDAIDKDSSYNLLSLSANVPSYNNMIHNIYSSDQPFYTSAIYKYGKTQRTGMTYDFQNIFATKLSSQLYSPIQLKNSIYMLQHATPYGHYDIDKDIYSYLSNDNGLTLPLQNSIKTCTYDKQYIREQLNKDMPIDSNKAIKNTYDKINFNMIYELPIDVYNDYYSSNVAANTIKTKNQYNAEYDMEHDSKHVLIHARDYTSIDNCGHEIYLKYYSNIDYSNSQTSSLNETQQYGITLENVEVIRGINRYLNNVGHKSHVYSVIVNTDMLSSVTQESIKSNLKSEIQNCVRQIVTSLAPAQTQLLHVVINETN